jgi:hypothetical protein
MAVEQERVIVLANEISRMLAGEQVGTACTALTLAVAAHIVSIADNSESMENYGAVLFKSSDVEDYIAVSDGFVQTLQELLRREDIITRLKSSVVRLEVPRRDQ